MPTEPLHKGAGRVNIPTLPSALCALDAGGDITAVARATVAERLEVRTLSGIALLRPARRVGFAEHARQI